MERFSSHTYLYPELKTIMGPNLGKLTLTGLLGKNADWLIFVYGIALILVAYILPKREIEKEVGEV